MRVSERALHASKVLASCCCLSLLLLQLSTVLEAYRSGRTNTAISYRGNEPMRLPSVTICPRVPHKRTVPMATEKEYLDNTWDLEDIFHPVGH